MAILTRWDPFTEIARLQEQLTRWGAGTEAEPGRFSPPVDIYEDEGAILIEADLPGVKLEDVQVDVEGDVLTLRGERKLEFESNREGYQRIESPIGTFSRSFTLPSNITAEDVTAEMNEGVLVVRLPKKAAPQPKKIEVKGVTQSSRQPSEAGTEAEAPRQG